MSQRPEGAVTNTARGLAPATRVRVLALWLASWALVSATAVIANWETIRVDPFANYISAWRQWDTNWFESIVVYGYVGPYVSAFQDFQYNVAFFPGLPMLMKAGTLVGIPPIATALLASLIAGAFASLAIARLTVQVRGRAEWGTIALVAAPTALFLTAAYTEALFCALAFWSWVYVREQRWVAAGVLAGGAALVRPSGLFLGIALIVAWLLARPLRWRSVWALALPFVATAGYMAYLHAITGRWTAWQDAQRDFWERHLVDPVTALVNSYDLIFTFSPTGEPSSRFVTEIAAMAIIVAVTIILIAKRWWAEAAYVGVTALALSTSSMYHSVPRTIVVLFPVWMLLGLWLTRYRWLRWVYLVAGIPFLVLVTIRFTQGQWIS